VTASRRARARNEIARLVHRTTGVHRLARDVMRVLERAVPFDGASLATVDPATVLPTGRVFVNGVDPDLLARLVETELREPDFIEFRALARQGRLAASLSEATRGDLQQSLRHRELCRPSGFGDELRVVLSDSTGTWGALCLLREAGRPHFDASEVGFLASLAPLVAEGLRRAATLDEVATADEPSSGVVVLAPDNSVETATAGADRWLAELAAGDTVDQELPVAVLAVAARARRLAGDRQTDPDGREARSDTFARARVCTTKGSWVTVRASVLGDGADSSVAVLMDQASPHELAPLIADTYGLTDRERRVTELVAKGLSTNEIGQRLHLSAYTVQDHLKSIFDKTGAGSRGELVARLFFDHCAPRLLNPRRTEELAGADI
jgi:DNA-binding CsgD family transcriptional regulator/GAF domain-containing protein